MVRAGVLDQRVTFQSVTLVDDGMGGSDETWANVSTTPTVWASIKPATGRERDQADALAAVSGFAVSIRNRSDVVETWRMVWGGENYQIVNVRRAGTREMYLIFDVIRGAVR